MSISAQKNYDESQADEDNSARNATKVFTPNNRSNYSPDPRENTP
jgi:hypothetical protein